MLELALQTLHTKLPYTTPSMTISSKQIVIWGPHGANAGIGPTSALVAEIVCAPLSIFLKAEVISVGGHHGRHIIGNRSCPHSFTVWVGQRLVDLHHDAAKANNVKMEIYTDFSERQRDGKNTSLA